MSKSKSNSTPTSLSSSRSPGPPRLSTLTFLRRCVLFAFFPGPIFLLACNGGDPGTGQVASEDLARTAGSLILPCKGGLEPTTGDSVKSPGGTVCKLVQNGGSTCTVICPAVDGAAPEGGVSTSGTAQTAEIAKGKKMAD